ncbi:MAG: FMN-binding protein [Holdemania filiformis]
MKSSKKLTALLLAGLMMTTAACGTKNEPAQGSGSSKGEATITKTAKGFGGDVTVTVNFDKDGKLTSVEAAGDEETPTIGGQAIRLPAKILEAADVDGVAGHHHFHCN